MVVIKGGHMEVYDAQAELALASAIRWFSTHLAPAEVPVPA